MTDADPSHAKTWRYHFTRPGGAEIEAGDFDGDEAAEARGREISKAEASAIVVERHDLVDWEYVTEVDERP